MNSFRQRPADDAESDDEPGRKKELKPSGIREKGRDLGELDFRSEARE